ncbi:winged helix-turn-helix domain-containing protein [Candidatus Enterococcus ferrettii]|uniref:OmpR/PhoB-type domain-containing protein n=1 Tax=Candidatus Enterococcus ferrettii TaxID=2815324 RepID=A0ABV0EL31_9ENTE
MIDIYQILVLTENILATKSLQNKLQSLNNEVWCSSQLLGQLQRENIVSLICQQFQVVIFSNTIGDKQTQLLLEIFSDHSLVLLRETDTKLEEEEKLYWLEQGIHDWIDPEALASEIREKMFRAYTNIENEDSLKSTKFFSFEFFEDELETYHIRLSKKEKEVLHTLVQAKGNIVSRQELCEQLWTDGETFSNMSQLSCIIKRIKQKFKAKGIENLLISTCWGKGYQLEMIGRELRGKQQALGNNTAFMH